MFPQAVPRPSRPQRHRRFDDRRRLRRGDRSDRRRRRVALHGLFDDAAELMALHHGGVPQIAGG